MAFPSVPRLQTVFRGSLVRGTIRPNEILRSYGLFRSVESLFWNSLDSVKSKRYHNPSSSRPGAGPQRFLNSLVCVAPTCLRLNSGVRYGGNPGVLPSGIRHMYSRAGGGGAVLGRPLRFDEVLQKKKRGEKITMVTSYDACSAQILDSALVDMQLVGDSLANVVLGLESTATVDLDTMILFAKHVKQASRRSVVVFDLPYGTYHTREAAVESVISVVKRTGITTVKLEGFFPETVRALRDHVNVICHLGVQPQTAESMNSRGKSALDGWNLVQQSLELELAGCRMLVLEKVCAEVAEAITTTLQIPTIGIGSGPGCDGQVLVFHDMFGLAPFGPKLKFAKQYAHLHPQIAAAAAQYKYEVERGIFPAVSNSFFMPPSEREKFYALMEEGAPTRVPDDSASSGAETPKAERGTPRESIVREWIRTGLADRPGCSVLTRTKAGPLGDAESMGDHRVAAHMKRVCVRGGGALGQLIAWMLGGIPGVEVVLATRRQDLKEAVDLREGKLLLRKRKTESGLTTEAKDVSESRSVKIALLGNPPGAPAEVVRGGNFDVVLICTKSGQTADAAAFARANTHPEGIVASLQNGLEAPRILRDAFRSSRNLRACSSSGVVVGTSGESNISADCPKAIPGRGETDDSRFTSPSLVFAPTTYGVREEAPAVVQLTGDGDIQVCTALSSNSDTPSARVAALLRLAGLAAREIDSRDLQLALWRKAAVSAAINPLTAILRCLNGDVSHPLLESTRRHVVEEVVSVARAQGISLDLESTDHLVAEVARRTSHNISSMLADVSRGRPTEVDSINGEIVRQGKKLRVPTPVTECLLHLVQFVSEQEIACQRSEEGTRGEKGALGCVRPLLN
ncbi:3-methyl-2-oxobutanoate hydroxymethyltransferase [Cystoisospora suis]|uniref:3-methyl-2-oxobutanoate hydroxymethyltransferase n=1 Tax=Cystoisospora suis TaxID=483139 RepID=A0A2C6KIS8_9APIC|nr:3-methyl-2-oxobutanoate hydroxymethyltransferase [Cystoisospora suis]